MAPEPDDPSSIAPTILGKLNDERTKAHASVHAENEKSKVLMEEKVQEIIDWVFKQSDDSSGSRNGGDGHGEDDDDGCWAENADEDKKDGDMDEDEDAEDGGEEEEGTDQDQDRNGRSEPSDLDDTDVENNDDAEIDQPTDLLLHDFNVTQMIQEVIRDIIEESPIVYLEPRACEALQEAARIHVTGLIEGAHLVALHSGRDSISTYRVFLD